MSKIKVVQIAYMGDDDPTEYLDDKGRVWYDGGYTEKYDEDAIKHSYKTRWVTVWKQIDLPDEPEGDA